MKARLLLLLAAGALLLGGPAAAADANAKFKLKPGAAGKLCLECHAGFADTLKLPFVHTPVKAGNCADCHDPHASEHGKLLEDEPDRICAKCHGGMIPEAARSAHRPVTQGQCVSCHDPHASTQKANLKSSGNALCVSCHQELGAAIQAATHRHSPVDKGCLSCHDPHGSAGAEALLKKAAPALCLSCHKPDAPNFAKKHFNYPVTTADCTSCHDPHGSNNDGILWASVHSPVLKGMCNQCHAAAGTPDALKTKRAGADLCRGCHNDTFNAIQAKNQVHWPVTDRKACGNCHSPHASKTAKLLTAPQGALCGSCHQDAVRRQELSLVKHPPVEAGECVTCHAPHASDATPLLAGADQFEVCGKCHDWKTHSTHPIGEKAVDQRNKNLTLDCGSCHRTHGTPKAHLAHFDPKQELCVQCHAELSR
jgi:predicted CXXCH cytochrome family protein